MLALFKKSKKDSRKLIYSPVYIREVLGAMFEEGEILPHARMRVLKQTPAALAGLAYQNDETLFFVASHPNVIQHIESQGCVPLVHSEHLRFFRDKKRMNTHFAKKAL